jgi:hypothetical protein
MLLSAPIFIVTTFKPNPDGAGVGLELIAEYEPGDPGFNFAFENYILLQTDHRKSLLLINAKSVEWSGDIDADDLRTNEKEFVVASHVSGGGNVIAILDLRANTRLEAVLSIFQTIFVCIVLATGAMVFQNQTNDLVITPIENMIDKVSAIS